MEELRDRDVLILDAAGHTRTLLRQILALLGVSRVATAGNSDEALALLREKAFDIIFCDENARPHSPAEFVKSLRCDVTTLNVVVPLVLVSTAARFEKVKEWRDAGGNDIVVKPISPEAIKQRMASLVLCPKPFVTSKGFIGPDRRRNEDERRHLGERHPTAPDRRNGPEQGSVYAAPRVRILEPAPDGNPG